MKIAAVLSSWGLLACAVGAASPVATSTDAPPGLALRGVISWPGRQLALLENTNLPPWRTWNRNLVLAPGERAGNIEVLEINPGRVKLRCPDSTPDTWLSFSRGNSEAGGAAGACMQLERANADLVFQLHQELAARTLLRAPNLPRVELTLAFTNAAAKQALLPILERALAESGVLIKAHRDKFALAVAREADFSKVTPELWESVLRTGTGAKNKTGGNGGSTAVVTAPIPAEEIIPSGVINFPDVDINQVLRVFQELVNRTLVRRTALPFNNVSLRTQNPLSRDEGEYAFMAVFALGDLAVLPVGDKFLLVFPSFEKDRISDLVSRTKIKKVDGKFESPPGAIRLNGTDLVTGVTMYEHILGKPVEIGRSTPRPVLLFDSQGPLTKAEAAYGLELLFGVNGLSVVAKEDGSGFLILPAAALK